MRKYLSFTVLLLILIGLLSCKEQTATTTKTTQILTTSPPTTTPIQIPSNEIGPTVFITTISQRHSLGNSVEMAINDTLDATVNSSSFHELNAYISSNENVIKQTGKQGEVLTPPGQGVNWVFTFLAVSEGTSYIKIGTSPSSIKETYRVDVIKTFLTPGVPTYAVVFQASVPAGVLWSAELGNQLSPLTSKNYIVFKGVPNGDYDYTLKSGSVTGGGGVRVNGADQVIKVDSMLFQE